jgi:hypothetical protein
VVPFIFIVNFISSLFGLYDWYQFL